MVPACRTLDCVSIFAQSSADAAIVFPRRADSIQSDPWSTKAPGSHKRGRRNGFRFGVPAANWLRFFGDESRPGSVRRRGRASRGNGRDSNRIRLPDLSRSGTASVLGPMGCRAVRGDSGIWRRRNRDALHPVTAQIILKAGSISAVSAFEAIYRLAELARAAETEWDRMDFMLLPTAGNCYTHEQIEASPIAHNTNLGYYTNFVNLLDLAAIAIPAGRRANGMPFGIMLIGRAMVRRGTDRDGESFQRREGRAAILPRGIRSAGCMRCSSVGRAAESSVDRCWCVSDRSPAGRLPNYRLYALSGTQPPKPGLVFSPDAGDSIEVEVWAVPENTFGPFVAAVPPPLGNRELHTRKREDGKILFVRTLRAGGCARHYWFRRLEIFPRQPGPATRVVSEPRASDRFSTPRPANGVAIDVLMRGTQIM